MSIPDDSTQQEIRTLLNRADDLWNTRATQEQIDVLDAGEQCLELLRLYRRSHERMYKQLEHYKRLATQRGERMQIMYDYISTPRIDDGRKSEWDFLMMDHPEAGAWFDKDGVPVDA